MLIIKKCEYATLDSTGVADFTTTVNNSQEILLLRGWLEDSLLQPAILVRKLVKEAHRQAATVSLAPSVVTACAARERGRERERERGKENKGRFSLYFTED